MEGKNFSLLSQAEIDALISFLNEKGHDINSGVLSQDSIDKIVSLLTSGLGEKIDIKTGMEKVEPIIDNDVIKGLELKFMEEQDEDKVSIYVVCGDETLYLTPACLEFGQIIGDDSSWGLAIEPSKFNKVANIFKLDYTEDTYNNVVKRFAKIMYGDENANVAKVYLADAVSIASHITK